MNGSYHAHSRRGQRQQLRGPGAVVLSVWEDRSIILLQISPVYSKHRIANILFVNCISVLQCLWKLQFWMMTTYMSLSIRVLQNDDYKHDSVSTHTHCPIHHIFCSDILMQHSSNTRTGYRLIKIHFPVYHVCRSLVSSVKLKQANKNPVEQKFCWMPFTCCSDNFTHYLQVFQLEMAKLKMYFTVL